MVKRIKACLNGRHFQDEHVAVPVTGGELATAAAAAVAAGAEAVHVHPRDADGHESLRASDVAAAVAAIREACPGVPVGVTTGLWITEGDTHVRRTMVAGWARIPQPARPDFASVNVSEAGYGELIDSLRRAGIGVEAGVWSVADAYALASMDVPSRPERILVEVIDEPVANAITTADEILRQLDGLGLDLPRLLHGEGAACWPLVSHAGRLGLPTRIGLEDTVVGPSGASVSDNAELVRLALTMWEAAVR